MSWILLEYEVVYYLKATHLKDAHQDWLELREISDSDYDKKLLAFRNLAQKVGVAKCKKLFINLERTVGCSDKRPAVQIIVDKFKYSFLSIHPILNIEIRPINWPDVKTQTLEELSISTWCEIFGSKVLKKKTKIKKKVS